MKPKLLLLVFLLLALDTYAMKKRHVNVDSVFIYKRFKRAGTTADIRYNFWRPDPGICDTTRIPANNINWSTILSTSRRRLFFQHKEAGIQFAGEMYINGSKHFFIYCNSRPPAFIEDFTAKKTYQVDDQYIPVLLNIKPK